jgi:hypothetical protein
MFIRILKNVRHVHTVVQSDEIWVIVDIQNGSFNILNVLTLKYVKKMLSARELRDTNYDLWDTMYFTLYITVFVTRGRHFGAQESV